MKIGSLLILFIVLSIGCTNDSTQAHESPADSEVLSESLNTSKVQTNLEEQDKLFKELALLQQQVERGDYSQVEYFIRQVQAYISAQPNQMTEEERLSFPLLTRKDLIDFLKCIDMDSLKTHGSFDKNYAFGSAPKEYKPDSEGCPDLLQLSMDEETEEFSLVQNNSFLVDETFGCAESSTVYAFKIENGKIHLKSVDYAG